MDYVYYVLAFLVKLQHVFFNVIDFLDAISSLFLLLVFWFVFVFVKVTPLKSVTFHPQLKGDINRVFDCIDTGGPVHSRGSLGNENPMDVARWP